MESIIEVQKNHSSTNLSIRILDQVTDLKIYNGKGKLLQRQNVSGHSSVLVKINQNGDYFIHFHYANEIYIKHLTICN